MRFKTCVASALFAALLAASFLAAPASAQPTVDQLEKRLRGEGDGVGPAEGDKPPPYLGLTGTPLGTSGVRVEDVRAGGPAAKAGIRPGDVVVKIANQPIKSIDEMAAVLDKMPLGANVEFTLKRAGANRTVTVVLGKRPLDAPPPSDVGPLPDEGPPVDASPASLGVSLGPVTDELRAAHKLTVRRGAFILAIRPGSAADQAGLPINGVIVAAEGRRIDDPQQVNDIVRAKRAGDEMLLSYYEGDKLFRKTVRLGEGSADGTAPLPPLPKPPPDEGGSLPDPDPDPPKPEPRPPIAPTPRVGLKGDTAASLREEIASLRKLVERLALRVEELETKLNDPKSPRPEPLDDEPMSEGDEPADASDDENAKEEGPKLRRPERPKAAANDDEA